MTAEELSGWSEDFESFHARFAAVFARSQTQTHAAEYMRGMMTPLERKNGWHLAEQAGHQRPDALQRLLHRNAWSAEEARDLLLEFVIEDFGTSDAIGVLDETGFLKKGTHSVGVQRQYSGTAGKVDNCQIGVFLGYVSGSTHLLVDRRLYLPQSWSDVPERCRAAAVPETVTHQTKSELAAEMLVHCWGRGLPMRWVTGDEVYGNARHLRQTIDSHGRLYVLAVCSTTTGWLERPPSVPAPRRGSGRRLRADAPAAQTVAQMLESLPASAWKRLSLMRGEKGPRRYDWAAVRLVTAVAGLDSEELWLLARRSIDSPEEIAYYLSNAPATTPIEDIARVAMQRYTIEQCFEETKSELGIDHYEVRTWPSWHRHITLTMMAAAWLAHMRASYQKTEPSGGRSRTRGTDDRRSASASGSRAAAAAP